MQNAWVLNQEILINPELYHPWLYICSGEQACGPSNVAFSEKVFRKYHI